MVFVTMSSRFWVVFKQAFGNGLIAVHFVMIDKTRLKLDE